MVKKQKSENPMREIILDSLVLHGSSAEPQKLERLRKLLKMISNQEPTQTLAKKRIPTFKIRPGLHIGYKVTIKKNIKELLQNLLIGAHSVKKKQFNPGFLTFGVKEYIEVPGLTYQRDIGITGFDVTINLRRKGFRVKLRKLRKSEVGKKHKITKEETLEFLKNNFKINIEEK
jgi:large subunit ribosomal protein L5